MNSVSCSTVAWKFQLSASLWFELRGVWMLRLGRLSLKVMQRVYSEGAAEAVS